MPRINLSRIGSASLAAATGVIMSVAPVFAESTTTTTTTGGSVITVIITAANAASVTFTFELSAEQAAELAKKLAEKKAELAAPAETNVDENVDEEVEVEADDAPAAETKTVTVKINGQQKTVLHESETEKD